MLGMRRADVQRRVGGPVEDGAVLEVGRRLLPLLDAADRELLGHLVPGLGAAGAQAVGREVAQKPGVVTLGRVGGIEQRVDRALGQRSGSLPERTASQCRLIAAGLS